MSTKDKAMFRILGFIIGSVTSIFIILLVVGMPTFNLADTEADQQRYDAAIEKLKAKQHEIESVTGKLSEDMARVAETVESGLESLTDASPEPTSEPVIEDTVTDIPEPFASPERINPDPVMDPLWYSFWNPFRSEIAAKGFVSQLEKVTGIDYRIVKVKTGVYEVAFAYNDDTERRTKLTQISAATGLDLPDS